MTIYDSENNPVLDIRKVDLKDSDQVVYYISRVIKDSNQWEGMFLPGNVLADALDDLYKKHFPVKENTSSLNFEN